MNESKDITKARMLLDEAGKTPDPEQRIHKIKEGLELLDNYLDEHPNLENAELQRITNLKHSYARQMLTQLPNPYYININTGWDYFEVLTETLSNEVVLQCQDNSNLGKARQEFIELIAEILREVSPQTPPTKKLKPGDINKNQLPIETIPTRYYRLFDWAVIFYEDLSLFDKPYLDVVNEEGVFLQQYISKEFALEYGIKWANTNDHIKAVKLLHTIPINDATDEPIIVEVNARILKQKPFAVFALQRDLNGNVTDKFYSKPLVTFSNKEDAMNAWNDEWAEYSIIDDTVIVHYNEMVTNIKENSMPKRTNFNWEELSTETFPTCYYRLHDWWVVCYEDMSLFDQPFFDVIGEDGVSYQVYTSQENALEDGVAEAKANSEVKAVKLLHAIPTEDAKDEPIIIEVNKHVLKQKRFAIFTLRREQKGTITDKISSEPLVTFASLEEAITAWSDDWVEYLLDDAVIVHYIG